MSSLGEEDALIIVCSGGFTREARKLVNEQSKGRVQLIDLEKFCDLWIEHYENLDQEAHETFPLRAIHFLDLGG